MKSGDLIAHAMRLARATKHKPRQVDLKRAVSAAYYALFHSLARECADTIIGNSTDRSELAWLQVYRALEHGVTRNACARVGRLGLAAGIGTFADTFIVMQQERHTADYDPSSSYTRADVISLITNASQALELLAAAPRPGRRAFVALVLLREPRR